MSSKNTRPGNSRGGRKSASKRSATRSKETSSSTEPELDDGSSSMEAPPPNFSELTPIPYTPPQRDEMGRFVQGQSGNPAGRPPNRKNQLTEIKQELELAVRRNISPAQIAQVVHRLYELALMGSVGAAKVLLDKTVSNARSDEDENKGAGGVTIRIENLTIDPESGEARRVIDVTPPTEENS